ncbi:MAG: hypothetical protein LBS91_07640 [Clostridiales Family XIII bacterium]|jgi:cell division protein FtsL|nr:hypothetical protein [Clostridiales Family XIII bacterium]
MASANAELNQRRRRADAYAAPGRRAGARPAYQPYTAYRTPQRATQQDEADYHPAIQLKTLTPSEIRAIVLVVFVVTAVAIGVIALAAQAAVTQKEINDLKKDITQVGDDIANIKIEIEQAQNMQSIKGRAQSELGMSEPMFDQYVYVSDLPEAQADFSRYIKERAYGGERTQATESEPESEQ